MFTIGSYPYIGLKEARDIARTAQRDQPYRPAQSQDRQDRGAIAQRGAYLRVRRQAVAQLQSYPREALLGQLIRQLYPSQADYQTIGERSLNWLQCNSTYSDERFMQHRDGEVFWARANGRTLTPQDPFEIMIWHFERLERTLRSSANLTPREREISTHIVNGLTCKEIARQLVISHRTVEVHRAHGNCSYFSCDIGSIRT